MTFPYPVHTAVYCNEILCSIVLKCLPLHFSKLHLYSDQKVLNFHLIWTNVVAIALILTCVFSNIFIDSYKAIWLELTLFFMESGVLAFSLKRIYNEIELLGFKE